MRSDVRSGERKGASVITFFNFFQVFFELFLTLFGSNGMCKKTQNHQGSPIAACCLYKAPSQPSKKPAKPNLLLFRFCLVKTGCQADHFFPLFVSFSYGVLVPGLATLAFLHLPLLSVLSQALRRAASNVGAQELGTTAWAFATLAVLEASGVVGLGLGVWVGLVGKLWFGTSTLLLFKTPREG